MRRKAALFLNGFYDDRYPDFYRSVVCSSEVFRVCADGALNVWERWRKQFGEEASPDRVVGDFDSLDAKTRRRWERRGVLFDTKWNGITDKDDTDGQLALHAAKEAGCVQFEVFGALPKPNDYNVDHFLGNLFLLSEAWALRGTHPDFFARLSDPRQSIYFVVDRLVLERNGNACNRVSLIPFGGETHLHHSEGLKWRLDGLKLTPHRANALRNEFEPDATFCIIELKPDSAPVVVVHNW